MKKGLCAWWVVMLWVAPTFLFGQITQTQRYEHLNEHSGSAWVIVPLGEKGLALFRDPDEFENGKKVYELITLDTILQEKWSVKVRLPHLHQLVGYDFANDLVYLLFREGETDHGDLMLVTVSLHSQEITHKEIKQEFALRLTHFWVVGTNVVLGGYVAREPAVLIYDPIDSHLKVVPGFFTSETELLDVRTNQNETFNTLVITRNGKLNRKLILRTFDKDGAQLLEDVIDIEGDINILTGLTSGLHRDELMIAGTYTVGVAKTAAGVFSILVDPFREQAVHYYDFAQLQHSLDYLNPKRAARVIEAARRDRTKGRIPEFRSYAATVRLEEHDKGFLLLTELYNASSARDPYYHQAFYPYSPYGNPAFVPYSNRYYNSPYSTYSSTATNSEVRFLSANVIAFNEEGTLDWAHSLPLDEKRKPALEQISDFIGNRNEIAIGYKNDSKVYFRSLNKGDEMETDTLQIRTQREADEIRHESKDDEGIRHWYHNNFFVWGHQTLRDKSLSTDKTRVVFYIVKLNAR